MGSEEWDDAISQAWLYATHPEIDVPFMAIADGSRFAVYRTTVPNWDEPECDFPTASLVEQFDALRAVLGADRVTRAVRIRNVRHLGLAMRAETAVNRLDEYVSEVRRLATEARPIVEENYRAVIRDQSAIDQRSELQAISKAGLFAIGVWVNRPFGVSKRFMGLARDELLKQPAQSRRAAFQRFVHAAQRGQPRAAREFWNYGLVRLYVALTCVDQDGCEFLDPIARQAVRDHLLDFPGDPLARAAHRLERILPAFTGRVLRGPGVPDLAGLAQQIQQHWSDEVRARQSVDADRLYLTAVIQQVEHVWDHIEWTTEALSTGADELAEALPRLHIQASEAVGLAHDPHFEWDLEVDQLEMGTLYELGSLIEPRYLDPETADRLRTIAESPESDPRRLAEPARHLLDRYQADQTNDTPGRSPS